MTFVLFENKDKTMKVPSSDKISKGRHPLLHSLHITRLFSDDSQLCGMEEQGMWLVQYVDERNPN